MNKYQEARKIFERIICNEAYNERFQNTCKLAIELIEKATPQRPIYINDCEEFKPIVGYICPRCSDWVSEWANYCSGCGQALNWEIEVQEDE